ncbi:hypothetical protein DFO58_0776 [Arthrobacter sp. AG1021]|nr:hypothetical protein DFO58_0776 [Arthrobacter sp. AG1021]
MPIVSPATRPSATPGPGESVYFACFFGVTILSSPNRAVTSHNYPERDAMPAARVLVAKLEKTATTVHNE